MIYSVSKSYSLQKSLLKTISLLCSDEMSLLYGGQRGYNRHNGNRNHSPKHNWERQKKKYTGQFISPCVRETESFTDDQG